MSKYPDPELERFVKVVEEDPTYLILVSSRKTKGKYGFGGRVVCTTTNQEDARKLAKLVRESGLWSTEK